MATVITVHGTFAHAGGAATAAADGSRVPPPATGLVGSAAPGLDRQWWEPGSRFEQEIREFVEAPGGTLDVTRFEWSGANSELGRREAGSKLLARLKEYEARKEPYCLIGHSHGGSVIAAALLEGGARRVPLNHLKRWITVGTPFVSLRKETWLFARLDLLRKVIFVASMMLLLMFLFYLVNDITSGRPLLFGASFPGILVVLGVMMSLPMLVTYVLFRYFDGKSMLNYSGRAVRRARETFASRWLSLAHKDDEAIQGLTFLPGAKLYFFSPTYAVSTITALSVFALPLMYLLIVTSPSTMVGIADWLNSEMYGSRASPATEKALQDARRRVTEARKAAIERSVKGGSEGRERSPEERRAIWAEYRDMRRSLEARFPDLPAAERAQRFRSRFFEQDDAPCAGGKLCGGGHDLRINSGLLLHVVTDELTWAVGGGDSADRQGRFIWSLLLPAILVPSLAGLVALALMMAVRMVAVVVSRLSSHVLNQMTNAEVKRAAFGNDTEGEIAIGAIDRPAWIERSPPRLPGSLGDRVTDYSNGIASQSLAKFRNAIGQLAAVDPKHTADTAITTYFTWKELVHSAYFDVPEFRKLVAQAVSRTDGFAPTARFKADPDFARSAQWLAEIETTPGTITPPGSTTPGPEDAAAVAAALASTVKAEP